MSRDTSSDAPPPSANLKKSDSNTLFLSFYPGWLAVWVRWGVRVGVPRVFNQRGGRETPTTSPPAPTPTCSTTPSLPCPPATRERPPILPRAATSPLRVRHLTQQRQATRRWLLMLQQAMQQLQQLRPQLLQQVRQHP